VDRENLARGRAARSQGKERAIPGPVKIEIRTRIGQMRRKQLKKVRSGASRSRTLSATA
jgi:hypothetical protein